MLQKRQTSFLFEDNVPYRSTISTNPVWPTPVQYPTSGAATSPRCRPCRRSTAATAALHDACREASASTAPGYASLHLEQQARRVDNAFNT
jgi:hypothetical protein